MFLEIERVRIFEFLSVPCFDWTHFKHFGVQCCLKRVQIFHCKDVLVSKFCPNYFIWDEAVFY